jgi:hypothetical protein
MIIHNGIAIMIDTITTGTYSTIDHRQKATIRPNLSDIYDIISSYVGTREYLSLSIIYTGVKRINTTPVTSNTTPSIETITILKTDILAKGISFHTFPIAVIENVERLSISSIIS